VPRGGQFSRAVDKARAGATDSLCQCRQDSVKLGGKRTLPMLGATTVALLGVAGGGWAFASSSRAGTSPSYGSARQMAARAGCLDTFSTEPAPPGVSSAGSCTISGNLVEFRVQQHIDTADPWPQAGAHAPAALFVGDGWLVRAVDLPAYRAATSRLQ
jgi:hypothetical protein